MANLIILAGVPGSGKSTWARTFFDLKYSIVSSDAIREKLFGGRAVAHDPAKKADNNRRVFEEYHQDIEEKLEHNVDVIADATNLNRRARNDLCAIAERQGADAHLVLFKNVLQAEARNKTRDDDHVVPDEVMAHMFKKYYDTLVEIEQEKYVSITKIAAFE